MMTSITGRPIAHHLSAVLLVLGTALAAWNWYLNPQHAFAWGTALVFEGGMAIVFGIAIRAWNHAGATRVAANEIIQGIAVGAAILVFSLGPKLLATLGTPTSAGFPTRAMMIILGLSFIVTGNALPKTSTCASASAQTLRRFIAWTWVLMGLAFTIAWLVLPIDAALPVSMLLIAATILLVISQILRHRQSLRSAAH